MIYLDNAATTFPKPGCVVKEFLSVIKNDGGNPARSSHRLSVGATERIYKARESIARLLSVKDPERTVFTYNATQSLNLAIKCCIPDNSHVICSDIEHNAVIRPLEKAKRTKGIRYSLYDSDKELADAIIPLINSKTKAIVSTIESNVTGKRIELEGLSRIAREYGLFLIIDGSQAVGHRPIDMSAYPCDVLCAPSHKGLFGIQGVGITVFSSSERFESFMDGGSGFDSKRPEMPLILPEGYEAGTPATAVIASVGAGCEMLMDIGLFEIESRLAELQAMLADRIHSLKETILYPYFGSIISFNVSGMSPFYVARELDKSNIALRDGLHCAPLAHKKLGTLDEGTLRASLSYFNTKKELDCFYKALKRIIFMS